MTILSLATAGIKGQGLQVLANQGVRIPSTQVVERPEKLKEFLEDKRNWDEGSRWIVRPSPIADENQAPMLSGLFPSEVFSSISSVSQTLTSFFSGLESAATVRRLEMSGLGMLKYCYLIQPYLSTTISGIAHISISGNMAISWMPGHLADIAQGKRTGHSLFAESYANPLHAYGPPEQEQDLSSYIESVFRAVVSLNTLRHLKEAYEIEWLVTPTNQFYALQLQRINGKDHGNV